MKSQIPPSLLSLLSLVLILIGVIENSLLIGIGGISWPFEVCSCNSSFPSFLFLTGSRELALD